MGIADYLNIIQQLAQGMLATLFIFVLTLVFSMPLGLVVAFGRMSKWAPFGFLISQNPLEQKGLRNWLGSFQPIQFLAKVYISILRGTPLMLQLLVVYFGPYYVFGISLSKSYRFVAVLVGFSINYAAYFAEIYRSGIESIPVGQYEAAAVLGYNKYQTFFKIVFPQMVKRILPPVTNEIITLVKDTAMAFVLNYTEMFTLAKQIAAAKTTIIPLFIAGAFYFIFNAVVAYAMERVERALSYYR
ncbi:inner membrane amino-acid ABC transporter permease protein YecS [Anaerotignum neopropionicum]|uniref:Inner membrane amino-acid ABC transporter permease protein YecS n=1 Tax=Anaerotignum neopropionicum TaxID=36847 RepID=A0A136WC36_9FIRM|nr:amino acid ABC transporter permease [Anaerotignum neopropionicum]KXL52085.1 inner membrane amino-acid ABC transporter permease protein YecS [Anaerotignum neopropionicum]